MGFFHRMGFFHHKMIQNALEGIDLPGYFFVRGLYVVYGCLFVCNLCVVCGLRMVCGCLFVCDFVRFAGVCLCVIL